MSKPITDYTGMVVQGVEILSKLPPLEPGTKRNRYVCKCTCGNHFVAESSKISKAYYYGTAFNCGCKSNRKKPGILVGRGWRTVKKGNQGSSVLPSR